MLIAIDPGHGGDPLTGGDSGACCNGVREADVALEYAIALTDTLGRRGTVPLLTRNADEEVSLRSRCRAANDAGAAVFVSLHCNAAASELAEGTSVFYCAGSDRGRALAERIRSGLASVEPQIRDRGVHPDDSAACGYRRLYVLRGTAMPAVLVELGFITSDHDRALLLNADRRRRVVDAIAAALVPSRTPAA